MVIHGDCLLDFLAPFAHISVDMVEFVEHAGLCRSAAPQCLLFSEFTYGTFQRRSMQLFLHFPPNSVTTVRHGV